jgi:hypothetical protein
MEQRKELRVTRSEPTKMESWFSGDVSPVVLKDYSSLGARIELSKNLHSQTGDYITLEEPKTSQKLYGEIRWARSLGQGVEVGVRFHTYDELVQRLAYEVR